MENKKETKKEWDNIEVDQDKFEQEQAKVSQKYEVNPGLKDLKFTAKPTVMNNYGRESIVLRVSLHKNWQYNIPLKDSDQTYVKLLGLDKEYIARVGWQNSRKAGKESVRYIGSSVKVEKTTINIPFRFEDFKNLEAIGFIKELV